jgi:hypothetical protein
MRRVVLSILVLLCLNESAAANVGAADLKRYCEEKTSPMVLYCAGFIQGVVDTLHFTDSTLGKTPLGKGIFTCVPEGVNPKAIQGIVEQYLAAHTDTLGYSAMSEIGAALAEAYPCPKKSN